MSRTRQFARKVRRLIVYVAGAAVVVLVVFIVATNVIGSRVRQQLHEKLTSKGLTPDLFRHHDTTRRSIEPDHNGAPFYRAAFMLIDSLDVPTEDMDELPYVGDADVPALGVPLQPDLLSAIEIHLQARAMFFALVDVAHRSDSWRFDIPPLSPDIGLFTPEMTLAARTLLLRAVWASASGSNEAALGACEHILGLNVAGQELRWPAIIVQRTAVAQIARRALEQCLSRTVLDIVGLLRLREYASRASMSFDVTTLVESDIVESADQLFNVPQHLARRRAALELIRRGDEYVITPSFEEAVTIALAMKATDWEFEQIIPGYMPAPDTRIGTNLLSLWQLMCPGAFTLKASKSVEAKLAFYESLPNVEDEMSTYVLSHAQSTESHGGVRQSAIACSHVLGAVASLRVAATALTVEAHRLEHLRWPEDLAELGEIDVSDPFSGASLMFKKTSDGCLIYSIGINGQDDAGHWGDDDDDLSFRLFVPDLRNAVAK